ALAQVLTYATQQSWYSEFYNALPLYNGMKMKSGTIGGSKAFAGIHTNKQGKTYAFAIIINNYNGSPKSLVEKMYQLLNVLK
ncbi:MAG TPA: D-alanyl-D-alanine carboxypeptidase/D-alanyl-D-alanine-endopeptidase, partial [Chitinophagaceae bacterium]|nr:D-alanyl-D-alanine carboxypeptidase/D-alanyl-D-alanine-endopeptidase [Chitinophagaceae bacterium]